jgi:fido (protein-threonine AMPylation protein)
MGEQALDRVFQSQEFASLGNRETDQNAVAVVIDFIVVAHPASLNGRTQEINAFPDLT